MAPLPTVRLKGKDGRIIKINAANYAGDIEAWLTKGFQLVGEETRMEGSATVQTGNRHREPRNRKGVRRRQKPLSGS